MQPVTTKIEECAREFWKNLHEEYHRNDALQKSTHALKAQLDAALAPLKPVSSAITGLAARTAAACDSLTSGARSVDDWPSFNPNAVDSYLKKSLSIPQYYGGVWGSTQSHGPGNDTLGKPAVHEQSLRSLLTRAQALIQKCVPRQLSSLLHASCIGRVFSDYAVLSHIENALLPAIMEDAFAFKVSGAVSEEVSSTLRRLRNEAIARNSLNNAHVQLSDLRRVQVDRVFIKNFRKLVKCRFEFTVTTAGEADGQIRRADAHYSGVMDFAKNRDDVWIADNFSYERL
ncbi:hypothetical protein PAPHI01_1272 [Pancytospora philotis]|nr:hypothetical protein PAPHI01_1272 [Pancytospora philotis]